MATDVGPWNHNIAYHGLVLGAAPIPCLRALDVGCGQGFLLAELASRCGEVLGVDVDQAAVDSAAIRLREYDNVTLLRSDVLAADLPEAGFDLVSAISSFHHLALQEGPCPGPGSADTYCSATP